MCKYVRVVVWCMWCGERGALWWFVCLRVRVCVCECGGEGEHTTSGDTCHMGWSSMGSKRPRRNRKLSVCVTARSSVFCFNVPLVTAPGRYFS